MQAQAQAKPSAPGKVAILIGGIGCIILMVGAILTAFWIRDVRVGGVGVLLAGIGALFACFAPIGMWQSEKVVAGMIDGIMGLVAGVIFLVGGILGAAQKSYAFEISEAGGVIFAVFLLFLGLILWKLQTKFNTESALKIDLTIPAVITTLVGACTSINVLLLFTTIPAALLCAILFFLKK